EEYDYPFAERVKLLCKINIPYKNYRQWESSDKLFLAAAKYIGTETAEDGVIEVILEKPDGKQTTIALTGLRKEDQEYVKEQQIRLVNKDRSGLSPPATADSTLRSVFVFLIWSLVIVIAAVSAGYILIVLSRRK
ncbi:MAG: hypothetical protein LBH00_03355, partial [Planctomycetaceae bacterium]|nr:hypothetical protein [Planctomycetaceae bacterium]